MHGVFFAKGFVASLAPICFFWNPLITLKFSLVYLKYFEFDPFEHRCFRVLTAYPKSLLLLLGDGSGFLIKICLFQLHFIVSWIAFYQGIINVSSCF